VLMSRFWRLGPMETKMRLPYRDLKKSSQPVYRTRNGKFFAIRLATGPRGQSYSYWLIVRGWGDAGGWSWYNDDQFVPAPDVCLWKGRDGGGGIEIVLPVGAEPRTEWLRWEPEGWNGNGPWPLPSEVPAHARQVVPAHARQIFTPAE
jgi:hypothetical protein